MTNEELVYLYQQGDKQALEKLIEQNRGIIYKLANKFYIAGSNSIDREDLEQEGHIGLITAANKYRFDIDNQAKFITYAVHWIYQNISRYINQKNTNEETSLNAPIGEEGDAELENYIECIDYSYENIDDKLYNQQLRKEIDQVMYEHLTLQQRHVLKLRHGWDNNKPMTLGDVGDILDVTGEKVRQLENGSYRKLRRTSWGIKKAMELYNQKKQKSVYSISRTVENISFAQKYLSL